MPDAVQCMHFVTRVEVGRGYTLRLSFEDGSERVADLESHLDGEMFAPLRQLRMFRTARLNADLDTVVWDNGADLSPDFLYEIGRPLSRVRKVAEGRASYAAGTKAGRPVRRKR